MSLRSAGYDFLAFYTAGTFVRTGEFEKLYDLDAVRAFQQDVARRHAFEMRPDAVGPFWNPPVYALPFAPLSALPYPTAFAVWTVVNLICFAGAMTILCRTLGGDWRTWALVPLLKLTSTPFIMSIGHGQNTCLSLLILSGAVALWRGQRLFTAGLVAGLLFYKPQLGAVVACVMVACCGWRALAGLATTGLALLLTTLLTLPGTIHAFLATMPGNLAFMQVDRPYLWDRHVTLKAFWRLLVQGYAPGEMSTPATLLYLTTAALLAAAVVTCLWKLRRRDDARDSRDGIISVTVLSMPLLMPFYFDYDLLLLAVPATLAAREAIARGGAGRAEILAWLALYAWLVVNPHVATITRVNGTVILLAAVTAITMARAMKPAKLEVQTFDAADQSLRRAA